MTRAIAVPEKYQSLFWDTDISKIDIQKNKRYVIERVLEYGDTESVRWMSGLYFLGDVLEVLDTSRSLSPKSAGFWRLVLRQPATVKKNA